MTAALVFQLSSFLVSVALVPLILGFLSLAEFLVWVVFTTIGGLTLQLEAAIQVFMVRRAARRAADRDGIGFRAEVEKSRSAYRILVGAIVLVVLPLGWLFLSDHLSGQQQLTQNAGLAWIVFVVAYAINYSFGPNNVMLLSTARTDSYYWLGTVSRIAYFLLALFALQGGFGLLGLAAAFLVAAILNVLGLARLARNVRIDEPGQRNGIDVSPDALSAASGSVNLVRYTLFTLAGFLVYRGAFLLAVDLFPPADAAAYGLALQAYAIMAAAASLSIHVKLHHLAVAIRDNDHRREAEEVAGGLLFAFATLAIGTVVLVIAGPWILALIGSEVRLPATAVLGLLAAAFMIEVAVIMLINPMLLRSDVSFAIPYVGIAMLAIAMAAVAALANAPLAAAMVAVPLLVQLLVNLPAIFWAGAKSRGLGALAYLGALAAATPAAADRLRRWN